MPTIALDATPLLGQRTGIGVAVAGFVRHLAGTPGLDLLGYGLTARGWHRLAALLPPEIRPVRRPAPAGLLLEAWSRGEWPPVEIWTGRVDLVHGTNFVVPPSRSAGRLVSVWDLTAVHHPQLCTAESLRYPRLVSRALERGAWVHTGSHSVAAEIIDHFGVDAGRVRVVPPGVDRAISPVATDPPPAGGSLPAGGARPYLLALGRTEPRKDLPTLIRSFDLVAESHPDLELRIAGPAGWAEDEVRREIGRARFGSRVHRMGWVDDARGLLAGAAVFAYPSVYEGFGLPPREAMALGVPVVATAVGAIPEVAGGASELVQPGDATAMAEAITAILDDSGRRAELVRQGFERVDRYSWAAATEGLLRVYREMLGRPL